MVVSQPTRLVKALRLGLFVIEASPANWWELKAYEGPTAVGCAQVILSQHIKM